MQDRCFELNKEVVVKVIEGEAVIVFVKNAMIMSLNRTGTFIIERLKQNKGQTSFNELLSDLMTEYDINQKVASADLEEFLEQLQKNNLITYI